MEIDREKLIWMYTAMVRHREFEDRLQKECRTGTVPGFFHFGQGQEAITAGAFAAIRPDDYYTSSHRAHGRQIIRGEKAEKLMAEVYGRNTGTQRGKGGSLHLFNLPFGDLGIYGMIGTQCVVAPGAALSSKLRGTDQVTLCFFGDGGSNTGAAHEGMNLSACLNLPVVFICENNGYACTTKHSDSCKAKELSDRAAGYGIPGVTVDGNDAIAVYEVVTEAVARARRGEGPTYINCKTWRWGGHFEGDAASYQSKQELEQAKRNDPIPRLRKKLIEIGILTKEEAERIRQKANEEVNRAVKFAIESPLPNPEELLENVFCEAKEK